MLFEAKRHRYQDEVNSGEVDPPKMPSWDTQHTIDIQRRPYEAYQISGSHCSAKHQYQPQHPYILGPQEVMVRRQCPTLDNMLSFCNRLTPAVAYLKVLNNLSDSSTIVSHPASTLKWHDSLTLWMKKKSNLFKVNCREWWNALGIWRLKTDNRWAYKDQNLVFPGVPTCISHNTMRLEWTGYRRQSASAFGDYVLVATASARSHANKDRWSVSSISWLKPCWKENITVLTCTRKNIWYLTYKQPWIYNCVFLLHGPCYSTVSYFSFLNPPSLCFLI